MVGMRVRIGGRIIGSHHQRRESGCVGGARGLYRGVWFGREDRRGCARMGCTGKVVCHMTITCTGALEGWLCEAAGSHNSPGAQGETTRLL